MESNECNFLTCRYNTFGVCTDDHSRAICVDVAKKVLCLEEDENGTGSSQD
mgnify:FL=1|jgi:hypothetical protein